MRDLGDNIELWIAGGIAIALAVLLVWAFGLGIWTGYLIRNRQRD